MYCKNIPEFIVESLIANKLIEAEDITNITYEKYMSEKDPLIVLFH